MATDLRRLVRRELLEIAPYVAGKPMEQLTRELGVSDVLKFASNENPLGPSPLAIEAVRSASTEMHRYADSACTRLRGVLAEHLGITPDRVVPTCGSNEMILLAIQLFVNPGDEVVVHHPTFLMYPIAIQAFGGRVVRAVGDGLSTDLDAMRAAITPRTKMVFLCNPNNPTGDMVRRGPFERFMDSLPPDIAVVVDEAYFEYVQDPEYPNAARYLDHWPGRVLIVLRTFSKVYGLAALRVGYGIMRPEIADVVHRVRQPFNVDGLAQAAAMASLGDENQVTRSIAANRSGMAQLAAGLRALEVEVREGYGNFVLARFATEVKPLSAALERRGIILRGVVPFGLDGCYSRITVGTEAENLRLLDALTAELAVTAPRAATARTAPGS